MRCDRDRLCDSLTLLSLGATLGPTMNLAKRKLGLMVSTGPEHANLDTAVGLGRAALDRGAEVYLYLIDDGVTGVEDARVQGLAERVLHTGHAVVDQVQVHLGAAVE